MEHQKTTLVIVCMMNTHPEAFARYHPIFKVNFCEHMMLAPLICISTSIFVNVMLVPFFLLVWGSLRLAPINPYTYIHTCKHINMYAHAYINTYIHKYLLTI